MKDFFIKMLSSDGKISSKRFSAFFTLVNIIVLTYIATFLSKENQTPEFMFDALALIAGGGLGLTVIEKIFTKKEEPKKETPEAPIDEEPA
jgi:lipoprotein signal peptidase